MKREYVVGDPAHSRFLTEQEIRKLAPRFAPFLKKVFGDRGKRPYNFISRAGRELDESQIRTVLEWINT